MYFFITVRMSDLVTLKDTENWLLSTQNKTQTTYSGTEEYDMWVIWAVYNLDNIIWIPR